MRQWLAQLLRVTMRAAACSAAALVLAAAGQPALAGDSGLPQVQPSAPIAQQPVSQSAQLSAPKLTPELLAAYVQRQQALRNFSFTIPSEPSVLSEGVLSAYVARHVNPALTAIDMLEANAPKPSIDATALEKYAETKFVPTTKKVQAADREMLCLTQAIYHEARGEPESGQWAVANVIINRAFSSKYPSTLCGVVYQNAGAGHHNCQFSFACDGKSDNGTERAAWLKANRIALAAFREFQRGQRPDVLPKSVLFYHAKTVNPGWANVYRRVASIGDHVFYAPM